METNCTNMVDGSTIQENKFTYFCFKNGVFIEKYYLVIVSLNQQIDPCVTTRHFNITFHTIYAEYILSLAWDLNPLHGSELVDISI